MEYSSTVYTPSRSNARGDDSYETHCDDRPRHSRPAGPPSGLADLRAHPAIAPQYALLLAARREPHLRRSETSRHARAGAGPVRDGGPAHAHGVCHYPRWAAGPGALASNTSPGHDPGVRAAPARVLRRLLHT